MPGVATIQDMKTRSLLRADDELEELIQRSLHKIVSKRFELSIYFGCNLAERHADLSRALFNLFPVPLMKASFSKSSTTGKWRPSSIAPIPVGDLPASHRAFLKRVIDRAAEQGIMARAAFEHEFYLARETNNGFVPADDSLCFSSDGMNRQGDVISTIIDALDRYQVQLPLEQCRVDC